MLERRWKIVLGVLGVAVVGLIVALVLVASSASDDNDTQAKQIARLQKALAAQQTAAKPADITSLRRNVKQLQNCLPEMQDEISSLDIDRDTLIISPSSQVSRVCSPTVYGSQPGD